MKTKKTTTIENEVTLTSFTLKAIIRTGEYESISPEVTVLATSIEKAHEYVMPYIQQLVREYSINKRAKTPEIPVTVPSTAIVPETVTSSVNPSTPYTESFTKAKASISATTNVSVLNEYLAKVTNSVKINNLEKTELYDLIKKQQAKSK